MRSLSFGFICMMNKFIFSFNKSSWEWKFMDEWICEIYNNWVIVNLMILRWLLDYKLCNFCFINI